MLVFRLVDQFKNGKATETMARPSNRAERRRQIVQGLIAVMARRGYESASIAEIAKAAGLTSGLVHYHFKNKQEILLALLEGLVERHISGLSARLAEAGERPDDQLAAFIDRHLALGADADPDALACWVLLSAEAIRQDEIRRALDGALARLAAWLVQIIEQGVEEEVFTCKSVEEAAGALIATIQGYFMLAATARDRIPRGSAARSARKMAEGLLGAALPSQRDERGAR
jgi:TetR/AcrR family transcriptional repressor of bet genes